MGKNRVKKILKLIAINFSFFMIFMNFINFNVNAQMVAPPIDGGGYTANELVEDNTYDSYMSDLYFKMNDGSKIKKDIYKIGHLDKVSKVSVEQFGKDKTVDLDKYAYCIYKIGVVNAPYQSDACGYFTKGDSISITYEKLYSNTYESCLSSTLTSSSSVTKGVSANIDIFKIGISKVSSITDSLTNVFNQSHTFSTKSNITMNYNINQSGIYYRQRRANYEAYAIYSYEIQYKDTITTKRVGLYNNKYHNYSISGYKYLGMKTTYEYLADNGEFISYYESLNDGTHRYAGPILNSNYYYI